MMVFVGCNYEKLPFVGYRDAFREVSTTEQRIHFLFADVRISNSAIMQKVQEDIGRCDAGLYDVTFRNPNVMMELGIAIGSSKPWNILYNPAVDHASARKHWFDRRNTQLPANLRGYEYLEYRDKASLKRALTAWAAQALARASSQMAKRWTNASEQLIELLLNEPGLGINEIASKLGEHPAIARETVSALRKKRLLRTDGRGPGTRYYVSAKARRQHGNVSSPSGSGTSPSESPT